jgi:hypothetical protein
MQRKCRTWWLAAAAALGALGCTEAPTENEGGNCAPNCPVAGMPTTFPSGAGNGAGSLATLAGSGGTPSGTLVPFMPGGSGAAGTPVTMGAGSVALPAGSGGMAGGLGVAGTPTPAGMDGAAGSPVPTEGGCTPPPSGTFQTTSEPGGPGGTYTIYRPTTLGEGGFLHPPVAWGNGLATTPVLYDELLKNVASNGFVVIANPGTGSDPTVVRQGLEWLIEQNGSGQFAGKLAVDCAGTIGYSMGGGAAVGSGSHPAVKAIVSMHGLQDRAEAASGPILLTTSEGDTFVTKSGFVQPCYNRSSVQPTILASHAAGDHLDPLGNGGVDAEPAIAWLRYWLYGDQTKKAYFFGADCMLCGWPDFQRKNHNWD